VTIVSEAFQLGGTPDCIAVISGDIGLLDIKTCTTVPKAPYAEQLMAMAAHAMLWNGEHPTQKIHSCHLIYLPKDGSTPKHHAYANYAAQWREFVCLLAAFAEKHGTPKSFDPRDAKIAKLQAEMDRFDEMSRVAGGPKARTPRKRYVRPPQRPSPAQLLLPPPIALPPPLHEPMTMAELLRAYGHIPR
jgi:hypothetical protein